MTKEQYQHMTDAIQMSSGKRAEILNRLLTEPAAPERRTARRPLRAALLLAAALCLAVPVTAFATGVLHVDDHGHVQLGRFALGIAVDGNGRNIKTGDVLPIGESRRAVGLGYIDPSQVQAIDGQSVVAPSQTDGVELAVEDGKMMLYYCCGPIDTVVDISEELRKNGSCSVSDSKDGCRIDITVYPSDDPEDGQLFEGTAYRVKGRARYAGNRTGVQSFTFDVPRYASGNAWLTPEPLE